MQTDPFHSDPLDDPADGPEPRARLDLGELLRIHPRLLLACGMVALGMFPVGVFLAALGVGVLELSGGAARDTGIVVAVAGFVVSDFWGGGIVAVLTRARAARVAVGWALARLAILVVVALVSPGLLLVLLAQLVLAVPASWAGARVARKQAALRRQIRAERADGAATASPSPATTGAPRTGR